MKPRNPLTRAIKVALATIAIVAASIVLVYVLTIIQPWLGNAGTIILAVMIFLAATWTIANMPE